MTPRKRQPTSSEAWDLARRQHWVITHAQLQALGFSSEAVRHRIRTKRLHPIWRGVYAVGRAELGQCGWWMAAVLACGEGAVLSHESAAALWGIHTPLDGVIHVSVAGTSPRNLRGIQAHRRVALGPADVTEHLGIPVTNPVCTLIDIASRLTRPAVERAINEGDKRDLFDPDALRAAVDLAPGRAGVGRLRAVIDRHTFVLTDSELERLFLPIARRAGLPAPKAQVYVNGYRVDFYWPDLGLVVETDGLRYHRTPAQQATDRMRDQAHAAAGLTVLRFTHRQVRFEPNSVEDVLAAVHARLKSRRG